MENTKPTAIVRIHRPDLTPEERARRMEQIRKAAANLVIATMRNQQIANNQNSKRLEI